MSNDLHPVKPSAGEGYERQDIGVSGVLYFLLGSPWPECSSTSS